MEHRDLKEQTRPLRVLFYVQHLLGIGHLMRARRIAVALQNDAFEVTLVTGGLPVPGFEHSGVDQVALAAIAIRDGDFGNLLDSEGQVIDSTFKEHRKNQLLNIYRSTQPDIVMLEAYPFGRRQVRFELVPLIEAIKASNPRPILVTSLRDIVQRRSKPGRDEETAQLVNQYFDKVLVHGDPAFATLDESFPYANDIADKIAYTGLVCAAPPKPGGQRFDVVVSAGGGAVGSKLVKASLRAAELLPKLGSWCVVTGPHMPDDDFAEIVDSAPSSVTVERFRPDFTRLLAQAQVSVSQAGYNTVSDVLQARCHAVLIPYSAHGETEQSDRAMRLQRLGLAAVLAESSLSGDKLASAISPMLSPDYSLATATIDTAGAAGTGKILRKLFNERDA